MPAPSSKSTPVGSSAPAAAAAATTAEEFLAAHRTEIEHLPNGKIRCLVTGTDMPARLEILQVRAHEEGGGCGGGERQLDVLLPVLAITVSCVPRTQSREAMRS